MGTPTWTLIAAAALGAKGYGFPVPLGLEGRIGVLDATSTPDGGLVVGGGLFAQGAQHTGWVARLDLDAQRLVWLARVPNAPSQVAAIEADERGVWALDARGAEVWAWDLRGEALQDWRPEPLSRTVGRPWGLQVAPDRSVATLETHHPAAVTVAFFDAAGHLTWQQDPILPVPAGERRTARVDAVAFGEILAIAGTWTVRRPCGPDAECDVAEAAWLGPYSREQLGLGVPMAVDLGPTSEPVLGLAADPKGVLLRRARGARRRPHPAGGARRYPSVTSAPFPGRIEHMALTGAAHRPGRGVRHGGRPAGGAGETLIGGWRSAARWVRAALGTRGAVAADPVGRAHGRAGGHGDPPGGAGGGPFAA